VESLSSPKLYCRLILFDIKLFKISVFSESQLKSSTVTSATKSKKIKKTTTSLHWCHHANRQRSTKRKLQKQGRHSASIGKSILNTILMQQWW